MTNQPLLQNRATANIEPTEKEILKYIYIYIYVLRKPNKIKEPPWLVATF